MFGRTCSQPRAIAAMVVMAAMAVAPSASAAPAATPTPLCCVPDGPVNAVAMAGTTAYFGGDFTRVGPAVQNFGVVDATTGDLLSGSPMVDGRVRAIVADGAGGWYLGGDFATVGGLPRASLAHVLADGTVDPAWTPGTDGQVHALLRVGSSIFAGGHFSSAGGTTQSNLVKLDATTGAVLPFGDAGVTGGSWPAVYTLLPALADPSSAVFLYAGGAFTATTSTIGAAPRANLAAFTSTGATDTFDAPVGDRVLTLARAGSTIYAGGAFSTAGPDPDGGGPGVAPTRRGLAAFAQFTGVLAAGWDPDIAGNQTNGLVVQDGALFAAGESGHLRKLDLTTGASLALPAGQIGPLPVYAVAASSGAVRIGGSFSSAGGARRISLAALDASSGLRTPWDPNAGPGPMSSFSSFPNGHVVALATQGSAVAVGGRFTTLGGQRRSRLAAIDVPTGALTDFDGGVDDRVLALHVRDTTLYAGGRFLHAGGPVTRHRGAAFDTTTGALTAFDPDIGIHEVSTITTTPGLVFLGGSFGTVNGSIARTHLAAFDPVTSATASFDPLNASGGTASVTSIAASGDAIFVTGQFVTIGGAMRRNLARLQHVPGTLGSVLTFDAGLDGDIAHTVTADGATVYAGGDFTTVNGGVDRKYLAALDTGTGGARPWAPDATRAVRKVARAGDSLVAFGGFPGPLFAERAVALDPLTGLAQPWAPDTGELVTPSFASSPEGGLIVGSTGLTAYAIPPAAAAAPTATAADGAASVAFTTPPSGGAPITSYTVTATPGGATAAGTASPLTVTGLSNGTPVTFTVTATNAAGVGASSDPSASVTPSVPVTPPAGATPGGPANQPGVSAPDRIAPAISRLSLTNRRFSVTRKRTARIAARAKRGTTFRFTLSEAATTRLVIARKLPGRRKGRKCVKPQRTLKRVCSRYVTAVTLTRAKTLAGANRVAYSGRVGTRILARGTYRASLTAVDGARNRSKAKTITFTVVR